MLTKIQKRDGRTVPFNIEKIADAIYKAARAVGGNDYQEAGEMAEKVCDYLEANVNKTGELPTVEEVQDAVEKVLVESGHAKTAKAYILYRADRTRVREIIAPISKEILKAELSEDKRLRFTNKSHNEIYVITHQDSPNVMKEIGRLREIAFRAAGGGTGKAMDIDEYDVMENPYKQLVVWNPEAEEILGGYRYLLGDEVQFDEHGKPLLATAHMFNFSEVFLKKYLPYTVELGRSFVTLEYQSTRAGSKGLFALDNLWDGLGALTVIKPNVKYFFGKMTMYPSYHRQGRDMILYFLNKHFGDKDKLITPMKPLEIETDKKMLENLFCYDSFKEDYKILNTEVRKLGYNIPPLVNAYMSLSPTMRMFGTAINYGFGDVEETGILIAVNEILEDKRVRHIESFVKQHPEALKITSGAHPILTK